MAHPLQFNAKEIKPTCMIDKTTAFPFFFYKKNRRTAFPFEYILK